MSNAPSHSPEKTDSDFFTEHTQVSSMGSFSLIKAIPFVMVMEKCFA